MGSINLIEIRKMLHPVKYEAPALYNIVKSGPDPCAISNRFLVPPHSVKMNMVVYLIMLRNLAFLLEELKQNN